MHCGQIKDLKDELYQCSKKCINDHINDDKFDEDLEKEYNQCEADCQTTFKDKCVDTCTKIYGESKKTCYESLACNHNYYPYE